MARLLALSFLSLTVFAVGCRGWTSDSPPVHLNPNMDTQQKLRPYRQSDFFKDGRTMQTPPEGTIGRTVSGNESHDADWVRGDDHMYTAIVDGQVVNTPPPGLTVDEKLLQRGQERYNIYCAPCHARHGNGQGTVASRLNIKPPTFHDDVRYKKPLGHFYRVITHGKPLPEEGSEVMNMWSYAAQIPVEDRWAIALYVRALQRTTAKGGLPAAEVQRPFGGTPTEAAPVEGEPAEGDAAEGDAAEGDAAAGEEAPAAEPAVTQEKKEAAAAAVKAAAKAKAEEVRKAKAAEKAKAAAAKKAAAKEGGE